MKNIPSMRREYGSSELLEKDISPDPFKQFEMWFNDAIEKNSLDPNAMVLATVDAEGNPDARVVLLKGVTPEGFIFFTNYNSPKAIQAEAKGIVALNFYWPELARQIRIKGTIKRTSRQDSETYFAARPRESQISAIISTQSSVLTNRDELEKRAQECARNFADKNLSCPENWGGYCVMPFVFEFFQGRDNRLNDRIQYKKVNANWKIERLSP